MRPVSELKQDLLVSQSLGEIVEVLKTAALIQFRKLQFRQKPNENFLKEIEACREILVQKKINHPYISDRKNLPSVIMIVTSDEGFLGELNILLVNAGLDQRKNNNDEIVILGECGARYLKDFNENFVFFPGISDEISQQETERIADYLLRNYRKKFGRISVVYPEFISLTVQKIRIFQILPYLSPINITTMTAAEGKTKHTDYLSEEILIEPSALSVLEMTIELWITFRLLEIFWYSKQSEFAARIMHLEGSTQELEHLNRKFDLEYFKQVHSLRNKVIREITAARILLGKK